MPTSPPREDRDCRTHGPQVHVYEKAKRGWRCVVCRSEWVKTRRRALKTKLVEMFGGKCVACGYSKSVEALQFHHRDREAKLFDLSYTTYSWERMVEEARKCALVCANCHAEIEAGLLVLDPV
jgi:hypothetical protein